MRRRWLEGPDCLQRIVHVCPDDATFWSYLLNVKWHLIVENLPFVKHCTSVSIILSPPLALG